MMLRSETCLPRRDSIAVPHDKRSEGRHVTAEQRLVIGSVGEWLQVFKGLVEDPLSMLL